MTCMGHTLRLLSGRLAPGWNCTGARLRRLAPDFQGGPSTFSPQEKENFRHSKAVTSWRKGTKDPKLSFYYTLTLTCREEQWEDLKAGFDQATRSFTMLNPDPKRFVSPEKDPWLFF